jgi:predicted transcriptional regulator
MFSLDRYGSALADVDYLTRSPNRVRVLSGLSESPRERRELAEETGITRPTLSRILDELVERGWVARDGRTYHATALGRFLAGEFEAFVERVRPVALLDDVARWFPREGFEFELDRLATAEVVTATPTNAVAPTTHAVRELRGATEVTVVSPAVLPSAIEACRDPTVDGDQRIVAVVTAAVVDALREDPALSATLHEMLTAGRTELYRYDGRIPYPLLVTDDRVTIILSDDEGAPHAAVTSEDDAVRSWARTTAGAFRAEATRVPATTFAG